MDSTRQAICNDLDTLSRVLIERLGQSAEIVLASGCLQAAKHILSSAVPVQPASFLGSSIQPPIASAPQAARYQVHQPPPFAANDGNLDISSVAAQVAARLGIDPDAANPPAPVDLKQQWAGPLPSLVANGQAPGRHRRQADQPPEIRSAPATAKCRRCGDRIGEHRVMAGYPADESGQVVVRICSGHLVRTHALEPQDDPADE